MFDPELLSVIGTAALPLEQLAAEAEAVPLNTGQSIVILPVSYTHLTLPTKRIV